MLVMTIVKGNTQFLFEGSIGVSHNSYTVSDSGITENPSSFLMSLAPKVGYKLNDGIAVGVHTHVSWYTERNMTSDLDQPEHKMEWKKRGTGWGFSIFGRYKLLGTEKLSFLVETPIGINGSTTKEKTGTVSKKKQTMSQIFVNVFPAISYDLTEKISIIATCDFLSLGFSSFTIKYEDIDRKVTTNRFEFGAQSTLFKSLCNIRIGIIYNFF